MVSLQVFLFGIEKGGGSWERVIHEKGLKPNFPVDVKVTKGLHKTKREYLASLLKLMFLKLD